MRSVAVICFDCFPSSPRGIDNIPPPSLSNRGGRGERERERRRIGEREGREKRQEYAQWETKPRQFVKT